MPHPAPLECVVPARQMLQREIFADTGQDKRGQGQDTVIQPRELPKLPGDPSNLGAGSGSCILAPAQTQTLT
jgi:hypothetical protein